MSLLTVRLQRALGASYRIERELGGGGMSHVFLADEVRLRRKVVIKLLPPEAGAAVHADRFAREIEFAASLQHPHIVPLLAAGEGDGLIWYAMPFVDGESLADRIGREGALPVNDVLRIIRDVADALSAAHDRGLVHRDIKPGNILLAGRHAVVADFGVAKAISAASTGAGEITLTEVGMALGTPAYIAPEQAVADPNVDHRADLYALGIVAYEALSGRLPFDASSPQQMIAAHISTVPYDVRDFRPDLSSDVGAAVMRAIAKQPDQRWQTANELVRWCEQVLGSGSGLSNTHIVRARVTPVHAPRHVQRWSIAVAVLVLAGGAWFGARALGIGRGPTLFSAGALGIGDRLLIAEFGNHTGDATLGPAITEALRVDLAQSQAIRVISAGTALEALARTGVNPDSVHLTGEVANDVALREGAKAVLTGEVSAVGSGFVLTASLINPADDSILYLVRENAVDEDQLIPAINRLSRKIRERIGESVRDIRQAEPLDKVTTASLPALRLFSQAGEEMRRGEWEKAAALLEQAVDLDSAFSSAWNALAANYSNAGIQPERRRAAQEASMRHLDRLPLVERYLTEADYRLSITYDRPAAIRAYRKVLAIQPDHVSARHRLASALGNEGEYSEAIALIRPEYESGEGNVATFANMREHALREGNLALADSVPRRFLRETGDTATALNLQIGTAFALRDIAALDTLLDRLDAVQRDGGVETSGRRGGLALLHGQLRVMRQRWGVVSRESDKNADPGASLAYGIFNASLLPSMKGDHAGALAAVRDLLRHQPLDSIAPPDRPYGVLAEVASRAGDLALVRRYRAGSDSAHGPDLRALARDEWDGYESVAARNWRAAAAAMTRSYNSTRCHPCGVYEIAKVWDRAGEMDSARAWYALSVTRLATDFGDVQDYPLALLRLGEIHAARGERPQAADYLQRFLSFWREADPELQPMVARGRAILVEVTAEP